jgi:hypothetical protein
VESINMSLRRCARCEGFLPVAVTACPNCAAAAEGPGLFSRLGLAGAVLGGGAIAFTLMACYGMAPCADGTTKCYLLPPTDAGPDADAAGDGGAEAGPTDAATEASAPNDAGSDAAGDAVAEDAAGDAAASDAAVDGGTD